MENLRNTGQNSAKQNTILTLKTIKRNIESYVINIKSGIIQVDFLSSHWFILSNFSLKPLNGTGIGLNLKSSFVNQGITHLFYVGDLKRDASSDPFIYINMDTYVRDYKTIRIDTVTSSNIKECNN